jgi:hypothetical protein
MAQYAYGLGVIHQSAVRGNSLESYPAISNVCALCTWGNVMRTWLWIAMALCLFLAGAGSAKAAPLTDDGLKAMLDNLGYTVTVSGDKAPHRYKIEESGTNLDYTMTIELSADKDNAVLWIYAGLYTVPDDKPAPSAALLALLAKNDEIGPVFFSYSASNKFLYLNAPTANIDMTPAVLRQKIRNFVSKLDSTYSLWNVKDWKY